MVTLTTHGAGPATLFGNTHCRNRRGSVSLTLFVAASFSIYAITGCSGSHVATAHLDKYEQSDYTATMSFNGDQYAVIEAAARALEQKGFVVTLMAPDAGRLDAEWQGSSVIPEEQKEAEVKERVTVLDVILGVLLFVLIIGIVLALSDSEEEAEANLSGDSHSDDAGPVETTYLYVATLSLVPLEAESTDVVMSTERKILENGIVRTTATMMNKYFNLSVFDETRAALFVLQQQ